MHESADCNAVLSSLSGLLRKYPWQTKYVIFPSPRQADVALRAVARLGTGWVNAHGMGLSRLASMLAEPALSNKGFTVLSPVLLTDLVERAWAAVEDRRKNSGVAAAPLGPRTPGAVDALARTVSDLRMEAIAPDALGTRAGALVDVYRSYLDLLAARKAADRALVFETALRASLPGGTKLILAGGLYESLSRLERTLVDRLVEQGCERSGVSREPVSRDGAGPGPDAPRMAWIGAPRIPEDAKRQGPVVEVFQAASPWCEVREIWRRILDDGTGKPVPLEQVEIALVDEETYSPLVFEIASQFEEVATKLATFENGVHARHTRPARCLRKYLEWTASNYDAAILHSLLASGDLPLEALLGGRGPHAFRLARLLRQTGAFHGLAEGRKRLSAAVKAAEKARADVEEQFDEDGEPARDALARRIEEAKHLAALYTQLTDGLGTCDAKALSAACMRILELYTPLSELEGAAILALGSEMQALGEREADADSAALVLRFTDAVDSVRVNQSHPAPGRVHVTNLASAGLDGRRVTFVPGMDDSRYPGLFLQDPFLRDRHRTELGIRTRAMAFGERGVDARGALARLRGRVVVSWPARDVAADRDCFPSRIVLDAWRLGDGKVDDSYSDVVAACGATSPSYVPLRFALTPSEELVAQGAFAEAGARLALAVESPDIARGLTALAERESADFTEFDGCIGTYRDPCNDPAFVFSPSRLKTLAKCPMKFFFEHVLGLEAAEDLEWNPLEWLDALGHGSLMHDVFHEYGKKAMAGKKPDIEAIARTVTRQYAELHPCPSELAFKIELVRVMDGAEVFERTWALLAKEWKPVELEMDFGMNTEGAKYPDPVKIPVGRGKHIRLRGRIDRVDVRKAGGGAAVWDYKTGGFHDPGDNFGNGEYMQPALYAYAVKQLLGIDVVKGGFLFTTLEGQRVEAEVDCGPEGREVLEEMLGCLSATAAAGHFPPTGENCKWCDFVQVCLSDTGSRMDKVRGSAFAGMGKMIYGKKFDEP